MNLVLLVVALPFAIALIIWSILDLKRFVMIVVLGSMFIPGDIAQPGGANIAAMDVFLLIALASWLINNAVGNAPDPIGLRQPVILAATIFVVVQWVSFIWSSNPHRTLIFATQVTIMCLVLPIMFASLPRSLDAIERALPLILVCTAALAVALIIDYAVSHSARVYGPALLGWNKNAAGSYEAVGMVTAYALLLRPRSPRFWLAAVLVLDTAGLVASVSRGSMLGAAAGILAVSVLMKKGKVASLMTVLVIVAAYFAVIAPSETQKSQTSGSYSSATLRLSIWKDAIHRIEQHPVLGDGAGSYWDPRYGLQDPNNIFLRVWADTGLLGVLALLFMLTAVFRMLPQWRRYDDPRVAALAAACAGIFLSLLMHSQVDVSFTRGTDFLQFAAVGLLIALERLALPVVAAEPAALEVVVQAPALGARA